MLQPARRKYRKEFRGTMSGIATRSNTLSYGDFGIKTQECGWLSAAEIESARRTITHHTKRVGKFFLRVFPHKPITNKVAGARLASHKLSVKTKFIEKNND
ncbi:MAG: 50S ribosomal protein L16 [Candidatus Collierbacteria bacterium GW2011_GWB1_44_35]|uniref:50S ribosomal protein L16 n=1 Tax=Candidatus Collierbacteria bacterium GW2011_GWB1_44_35 TaxID=1618383 RepID=A0A0G1LHE4_9BACT|nr:MAG: 50S ribosomal protein L16 [Candidatus Collierbacteria bacterium GW2011_GWB1_44_35]